MSELDYAKEVVPHVSRTATYFPPPPRKYSSTHGRYYTRETDQHFNYTSRAPQRRMVPLLLFVVVVGINMCLLIIVSGVLGWKVASLSRSNNNNNLPILSNANLTIAQSPEDDRAPLAFSEHDSSILANTTCPLGPQGSTTFTPLHYNNYRQSFDIYCNVDWPTDVVVLSLSLQDSLESCIEYCLIWNEAVQFTACKAVSFSWNITSTIFGSQREGNCWLKKDKGPVDLRREGSHSASLC